VTGAPGRSVGFVGLGAMGTPMSRHLLAAGWRVLGHDPSASARDRLEGLGGEPLTDLRGLPAHADVVVTSLPGSAALADVVEALGRAAGGRDTPLVLVDTSTLSLTDKEAAREAAAAHEIVLLDCPVSGTSAQAEVGDLVAYLSGDDVAALERARPVVEDMTRTTYLVGEFGNGTKMKLVANLLVAVHNLAAAEALVLAHRAGLDLEQVLSAVGDGAGGSRMLAVRGPLMVADDFDRATARVEIFQKDLRAIQAMAVGLSSPTPLLSTSVTFYDMAMAQGRSQQDTACLYGVLQQAIRPAVPDVS
jgi:putative dehydrogenase